MQVGIADRALGALCMAWPGRRMAWPEHAAYCCLSYWLHRHQATCGAVPIQGRQSRQAGQLSPIEARVLLTLRLSGWSQGRTTTLWRCGGCATTTTACTSSWSSAAGRELLQFLLPCYRLACILWLFLSSGHADADPGASFRIRRQLRLRSHPCPGCHAHDWRVCAPGISVTRSSLTSR